MTARARYPRGAAAVCFAIACAYAAAFQNCSRPYGLDQVSDPSLAPKGLPSYSALKLGRRHACAVNSTGSVNGVAACWGDNSYGELATGSSVNPLRPVAINGFGADERPALLAPGQDGTCVSTNFGHTLCWGENAYGQVGDGTVTTQGSPKTVLGLPVAAGSTIAAGTSAMVPPSGIASAGRHVCAAFPGVGVRCWGRGDDGQLGQGLFVSSGSTVSVYGIAAASSVTSLTAGNAHTCALVDGAAKCWGANDAGALGDGSNISRALPADVVGLDASAKVATLLAGSGFTCALLGDLGAYDVKCWGENGLGQLGDGTTNDAIQPPTASVNLGSGAHATALAVGVSHSCAIVGGGVKCWGSNAHGELGDGTTVSRGIPADVRTLGPGSGVTEIAAGDGFACAIVGSTKIVCWGAGDAGQLGDGGTSSHLTPVQTLDF